MGMAGIKWGQRSSTIPPFLMNLNEEALLKVSFKNIDWFQICPFSKTTAFSKKALKTNKFWKIQNFFLHFWWQFYRAFQWYIVCFHTFSGCWYTEGNVNVKSHLHTTVNGFFFHTFAPNWNVPSSLNYIQLEWHHVHEL